MSLVTLVRKTICFFWYYDPVVVDSEFVPEGGGGQTL